MQIIGGRGVVWGDREVGTDGWTFYLLKFGRLVMTFLSFFMKKKTLSRQQV